MFNENQSKEIMQYDIDSSGCAQSKRLIKDGIIYIGSSSVNFSIVIEIQLQRYRTGN